MAQAQARIEQVAERANRVAVSWWFGHVVMFSLCTPVLLAAVFLAPSEAAVSLFGVEVPILCGFRRLTGIECPGCGMTRSFAFMAHGQVLSAFQMNFVGPFLFGVMATQPFYRPWALYKGWRERRRARDGAT